MQATNVSTVKPLSARQQAIVQHYLQTGSGAETARLAGYAASGARQEAVRLLSNAVISDEVSRQRAVLAEEHSVARSDVVIELLSAIDLAREQQNPAAMIAGCNVLCKVLGYYEPERLAVQSADTSVIAAKFKQMTDQELVRLVTGK